MSRNSRRGRQSVQRHTDRFAALERYLDAHEYGQALEMVTRILRDEDLPREARVRAKGQQVEVLIGLGRFTEGYQAAVELERMLERFRLWDTLEQLQPLIERAKNLQGA